MTSNHGRKGSYFTGKHKTLYLLAIVILTVAIWGPGSLNEAIKVYDEAALTILIAVSALVIPFVDLLRGGTSGGTENDVRKELATVVIEIILMLFFSLGLKMMIVSGNTYAVWVAAFCSYINLVVILAQILKIYQYKVEG